MQPDGLTKANGPSGLATLRSWERSGSAVIGHSVIRCYLGTLFGGNFLHSQEIWGRKSDGDGEPSYATSAPVLSSVQCSDNV